MIRRVHRILARGGKIFAPLAVFCPHPGIVLFKKSINTIKIHQKDYTFGVTEVRTRSKILTPLETTGGISFSLEGFEKMLFTI